MAKCGPPLKRFQLASTKYYFNNVMTQLRQTKLQIRPICEATSVRLYEPNRLNFNHPIKELMWLLRFE